MKLSAVLLISASALIMAAPLPADSVVEMAKKDVAADLAGRQIIDNPNWNDFLTKLIAALEGGTCYVSYT